MKFQTSALSGMMLDFACAQFDSHCEGIIWEFRGDHYVGLHSDDGEPAHVVKIITDAPFQRMLEICREYKLQHQLVYSPSTNWARGGAIIESHRIELCDYGTFWVAGWNECTSGLGDTQLIAAMRAFVASKAGDSIELAGAV